MSNADAIQMLERILYRSGNIKLRQFALLLFHAGAGVYSGVQTLLRAIRKASAAARVVRIAFQVSHAMIWISMERLVNRLKGFNVRARVFWQLWKLGFIKLGAIKGQKSLFFENNVLFLDFNFNKIYLYSKSSRFSRLEFRRFLFDDIKRDLCFSLIGEIDPDLNENKPSN